MPTVKQYQKDGQKTDKERVAYSFLTAQGWTPEQTIGIIGNIKRESGFNPNAIGDGGKAFGLVQWHPDRQAKAKALYGDSWKSFENQLKFIDWELKNTEKAAGDKLRNTKGAWQAGQVVSDFYERPQIKFAGDETRQTHVADAAMKFKGIKLTPEDNINYGVTYENSVAPYMNAPQIQATPLPSVQISSMQMPKVVTEDINPVYNPTTFATTEEAPIQTENYKQNTAEQDFMQDLVSQMMKGVAYIEPEKSAKYEDGGITPPETIRINDTRRVRATTNKPINPNVDLVTGNYKSRIIEDIVNASLRNGVDPDTALALAMQESKLGNIDENLGHIVGGSYRGEEANDMTRLLSDKMHQGRKLGKKTEEQLLQMYNGTGKIFPNTEQDYHGFKMKQAYGVPVPKEGIDMSKTPLYGVQVKDIRDNVIKKNKTIANTVKNLKSNFNHFEGTPYRNSMPTGEEIFQPGAFNNVNPKYFQIGGVNQFKKKPFQLQDERSITSRDATNVAKQKARPLQQLNVRNKTDKEIAQEREAKIQASIEAQKVPYTRENWRQQLAAETAATGDKLRYSNEPNFFDDYINPAAMIGNMATNLGQAPLQAQQSDSIMPYVTSIGTPLAVGAIGGLGTKTTGQFVNNIVNPLAGFNVKSRFLDTYRIGKEVVQNPKAFLREVGEGITDNIVEPILQRKDRGEITKIFNSKVNELNNPESILRLEEAGIDSNLFLQDLKKTKLDFTKTGSSMFKLDEYAPVLSFDINQAKKLRREGYNLSNESIVDHEIGHLMQPIEFRNQKGVNDLISMDKLNSAGSAPTTIDLESDILLKDINTTLSDFSERNKKYFNDAYKPNLNKNPIKGVAEYWQKTERLPFLRETKRELVDAGLIKNINSEVTPQILKEFKNKTNGNRILSFLPHKEESFINLSDLLNKTPAILPIAGASYIANQEQPQFQQGGTVKSDNEWLQNWYANRVIPNKDIQAAYLEDKPIYLDRLKNIPPVTKVDNIDNDHRVTGQYQSDTNKLLITPNADNSVYLHEANHYLNSFPSTMRTVHDNVVEQNMYKKGDPILGGNNEYYEYFRNPDEIHSRVQVLRKDAGFKPNEKVTQEKLLEYLQNYKGNDKNILQIMNLTNEKGLLEMLNYMAESPKNKKNGVLYAQQGGTYTNNEQNFLKDYFKNGGEVVKDNNGYWNPDNWGKVVEISSPSITMKGVNHPLLGISKETGEEKLMMPNQDYYFDNTKSVLEVPYMQKGGKVNSPFESPKSFLETINPIYAKAIAQPVGRSAPQIDPKYKNLKIKDERDEATVKRGELKVSFNKPIKKTKELETAAKSVDVESIVDNSQKDKNIEIQNKLINLGYDIGSKTGEADGIIGKKTLAALAEFKKTGKPPKNLSLIGEEILIRRAKPENSAFDSMTNRVEDNLSEYIVNPLKTAASKLVPGSLGYDPKLSTVGTYDETKGAKKYLLDNKSIEDIRKEKNISFGQISKNRLEGNTLLPSALKERIVNATNPQGYAPDYNPNDNFLTRLVDPASKDKQLKRLEGKKGDFREDIYRMYSGLPQKFDSFTASSFKAGKDSDTNLTFKNPEDVADYIKIAAAKTDLFKRLASGEITPESIAKDKAAGKKGADKINKAVFRDPKNVMWNATMGVDFDKSGQPYLSFYDNWDLALKDDYKVSKGAFGAPVEVYDRIPLTKELIAGMAKINSVKDSNDASDAITGSDLTDDKTMERVVKMLKDDPKLQAEYNKVLAQIRKRYE